MEVPRTVMQRWSVQESNWNHICLIEIHRRCSATLFSRYSFAKLWRRADERCFAFAAVVPACFADRPDRSWILAYHVVLSGLLIHHIIHYIIGKYIKYASISKKPIMSWKWPIGVTRERKMPYTFLFLF